MHRLITLAFSFGIALIVSSCESEESLLSIPDWVVCYDLNESDLIWKGAPHCAFTDLAFHNGAYYCCFREASGHLVYEKSDYGVVRILKSLDGESWQPCLVIKETGFDLRDPMFSITLDNKLFINYYRTTVSRQESEIGTRIMHLDDVVLGKDFIDGSAESIQIEYDGSEAGFWLWRIKWIGGRAYGVAYKNGANPILLSSDDGISFSKVCQLDVMGNEADLELLSNGELLIVMRSQFGDGFVGKSVPPFDNWTWNHASFMIHSPRIMTINGEVVIAGRWNFGTAIYDLIDFNIFPKFVIVQRNDYAYPGLSYSNGKLLMSYYGSWLNGTAIFLSKIDYPIINTENKTSGQ